MTCKSDIIKNFNSILESFLSQTSSMEGVGTTYIYYYKKLILVNAPLPIKYASEHMLMFKDQIINRDEAYFHNSCEIKDKFNELTNRLPRDTILDEILRLKDIYYKLDKESQDNLWQILQALLQLVIEYTNIKKKI